MTPEENSAALEKVAEIIKQSHYTLGDDNQYYFKHL